MRQKYLHRARDCYRQRAWSQAHQLFSRADELGALDAEDLERLAFCAYLIGRDVDFQQCMGRAHQAYRGQDQVCRAARCAFWLGLTLFFQGEAGRASGWLARAERLVTGRECVEHGYLLLPIAEQSLAQGALEKALTAIEGAIGIGTRFSDADLIACARHLHGRILIRSGRTEAGLGLLDEVMIGVSGNELSPIVTGLIYCSVVAACQEIFALSRAREWTLELSRWCEVQPQMVAFTNTCLVHRAEVMQFDGAWNEAMAEARRACELAIGDREQTPPPAAYYRQAELLRLQGEFRSAEAAYRSASRLGHEPQPGLALLRAAQGHTDAACTAISRALAQMQDPLQRARLLPAYVELTLAAHRMADARDAAAELQHIARQYPTEILQAMAAVARGAAELAEGQATAALPFLHRACDLWQQAGAPYELARVRLLMALACRSLEDDESADLEFDAASALFQRLGAKPDLERLEALRHPGRQASRHGLTAREKQVLRQIAAGRTNKEIARVLSLSERTIDRHVSSILTKLDVPSRAAATAYAYRHKLL